MFQWWTKNLLLPEPYRILRPNSIILSFLEHHSIDSVNWSSRPLCDRGFGFIFSRVTLYTKACHGWLFPYYNPRWDYPFPCTFCLEPSPSFHEDLSLNVHLCIKAPALRCQFSPLGFFSFNTRSLFWLWVPASFIALSNFSFLNWNLRASGGRFCVLVFLKLSPNYNLVSNDLPYFSNQRSASCLEQEEWRVLTFALFNVLTRNLSF